MGNYIDRDELVTLRTEEFGASTVRIRTRLVGKTAVIEMTEFSPESVKPVSKTRLAGLARSEGKVHVGRARAISDPIANSEIVRDRNRLDENGHAITDRIRVRNVTYVVAPR